ncbi:hypothetical protein JW992_04705 [candidate division KSB1 bacterium]|nr:hypothetical protein [candidate division KSB1 bacterium]
MNPLIYEKISKSCGKIDERVHACKTREVAEMLKERLCREFEKECQSAIIRNFFNRHVDSIINDTFDRNGMNKYLEES